VYEQENNFSVHSISINPTSYCTVYLKALLHLSSLAQEKKIVKPESVSSISLKESENNEALSTTILPTSSGCPGHSHPSTKQFYV
jgi:hypothetical protein